ncbi:hypothetical protein NQ314_014748 [Rhamnusium bicolor]|uniref:Cytochrome P450 n=1 Tax=Rhamnusium bicolor TaxID=1586634 RepID=A0AAV8X0M8_9CUCU|nr:hypothetical protein NQ314_014748 [Rhamnusium bicolor]
MKAVKHREEYNVSRPDFLQLLMELKNNSKDEKNPFTIENLAASVFLFFFAGFDTSTTTMHFTLYELCRNPDIQEKVRNEINEILAVYGGNITYDSLWEMTYLQQVIDGVRFGLMQTKIALVSILTKFRLRFSPSTKMPLHLDDTSILLKSIETLYLTAEKI